MRHCLRVAGRICHGDGPCGKYGGQCEPSYPERFDHRLQIQHMGVERVVGDITLGKARPPPVIAHQFPLLGKPLVKATPAGILPLQLDVAPRNARHLHEGRAFPQRPESDADAVGGLGILDSRFHAEATPLLRAS